MISWGSYFCVCFFIYEGLILFIVLKISVAKFRDLLISIVVVPFFLIKVNRIRNRRVLILGKVFEFFLFLYLYFEHSHYYPINFVNLYVVFS